MLFTLPGVDILSVYPDWMHVKHLGLDKKAYGSVLYALVHYVLDGDPAGNLKTVYTAIQEEYAAQRSENRYTQLKLSMFTTRSSPTLKGKAQ
eukprot:3327521-Heterocapsa_arctica.AAC.1